MYENASYFLFLHKEMIKMGKPSKGTKADKRLKVNKTKTTKKVSK